MSLSLFLYTCRQYVLSLYRAGRRHRRWSTGPRFRKNSVQIQIQGNEPNWTTLSIYRLYIAHTHIIGRILFHLSISVYLCVYIHTHTDIYVSIDRFTGMSRNVCMYIHIWHLCVCTCVYITCICTYIYTYACIYCILPIQLSILSEAIQCSELEGTTEVMELLLTLHMRKGDERTDIFLSVIT